jgi:PadR family transcriptional regulator, regulatory protein PadR
MKGQALKGHLDLLVLGVLADGPKHGYAVIEELRVRSGDAFDIPEGTLYPVLHRLERANLLASEWVEVAGRRRRLYRLTDQGRAALVTEQAEWQKFASAVAGVLAGGAPWPNPT